MPVVRVLTRVYKTIEQLEGAWHFRLFGTDMNGRTTANGIQIVPSYDCDGENEGKGVSRIVESVDEMVTIPMAGHVKVSMRAWRLNDVTKSSVTVRYRNAGMHIEKTTLYYRWIQYDWCLAGAGGIEEARRLRERAGFTHPTLLEFSKV